MHRPNMPYAVGVRSCVGQKIANSLMHILLSKVISAPISTLSVDFHSIDFFFADLGKFRTETVERKTG